LRIAGRARHGRVEQRLVVAERGQHQARDVGQLGPNVTAHLDPTAVAKSHIQDGDLW